MENARTEPLLNKRMIRSVDHRATIWEPAHAELLESDSRQKGGNCFLDNDLGVRARRVRLD